MAVGASVPEPTVLATIDAYKTATSEIARIGRLSTDVICATAGVHGFVQKTCGPSCMPAGNASYVYRAHKLPIYMDLGILRVHVSHRYAFIYVRQAKASSSTVLHTLQQMLCGRGACDESVWTTMRRSDISDATWAAYFVFTVVRNPWARLASAHSFLTRRFLYRRKRGGGAPAGHCRNNFSDFALDSYSLVDLCSASRCCAYLQTLKQWAPSFVALHITDQAYLASSHDGRFLVDYVGRAEHVRRDLVEVVEHINARANASFAPTLVAMNRQKFNLDARCSEAYRAMYDEKSLQGVAEQYAVDVLRFGFLSFSATRT